MDVLSVGGKDYVKASVIARDLGYTADYVGQLCRARKVNAKLVGRSWYVDRNSIHLHRTNRYRGTQLKAKEALRENVQVHIEKSSPKSNFYRYTPIKVSYEEDESELIPEVGSVQKKTGTLSVGLADATTVGVVSKSSVYEFDTPKVPVIKFKGSLTVSEIGENETADAAESGSVRVKTINLHPKEVEDINNKAKNIVSSPKKALHHSLPKPRVTLPEEENEPASASEAIDAQSAGRLLTVTQLEVDSVEEATGNKMVVLLSAAFSVGVAAVLVGLEASIWFTSETLTTSYLFGIDHLTASAYDAAEVFQSTFYLVKFSTNFFVF